MLRIKGAAFEDPITMAADEDNDPIVVTSSPCLLSELNSDGTLRVDPIQVQDVARWRTATRERLLAARAGFTAACRSQQARAIAQALDPILAPFLSIIVSVYWPIRGEPDLREWAQSLSTQNIRIALPVATALRQPLVFREWHAGARLARGLWKIPYPADGAEVIPQVVIAPLVGFDGDCYRLGYGGGFFDRTLATLSPRPLAIGVGYPSAALSTIFPQPHDVPMDWIVTGSSPSVRRAQRPAG
jgi:5,10-methenyltetrahydrofolate synthetase